MAIRAGQPESGDHVIICGANALTSRIAEELSLRYGLPVTAVVPSAASGFGARLAAMPAVRLLERAELSADALLQAFSRPEGWPCCTRMIWVTSTPRCARRRSVRRSGW